MSNLKNYGYNCFYVSGKKNQKKAIKGTKIYKGFLNLYEKLMHFDGFTNFKKLLKTPDSVPSIWFFCSLLCKYLSEIKTPLLRSDENIASFLYAANVVDKKLKLTLTHTDPREMFDQVVFGTSPFGELLRSFVCEGELKSILHLREHFGSGLDTIISDNEEKFDRRMSILHRVVKEAYKISNQVYEEFCPFLMSRIGLDEDFFLPVFRIGHGTVTKHDLKSFVNTYVLMNNAWNGGCDEEFEDIVMFLKNVENCLFNPEQQLSLYFSKQKFFSVFNLFMKRIGEKKLFDIKCAISNRFDNFFEPIFLFERAFFGYEELYAWGHLDETVFKSIFGFISRVNSIFPSALEFFFERWHIEGNVAIKSNDYLDFGIAIFEVLQRDVDFPVGQFYDLNRNDIFDNVEIMKIIWYRMFIHNERLNDVTSLSFVNFLNALCDLSDRICNMPNVSESDNEFKLLKLLGVNFSVNENHSFDSHKLYGAMLKYFFSKRKFLHPNVRDGLEKTNAFLTYSDVNLIESDSKLENFSNSLLSFWNSFCGIRHLIERGLIQFGFNHMRISDIFTRLEFTDASKKCMVGKFFTERLYFVIANAIIGESRECVGCMPFSESVVSWGVYFVAKFELQGIARHIAIDCQRAIFLDWEYNWYYMLEYLIESLCDKKFPKASSIDYSILMQTLFFAIGRTDSVGWLKYNSALSSVDFDNVRKTQITLALFSCLEKQQLYNKVIEHLIVQHLLDEYRCTIPIFPFNILSIFVSGEVNNFDAQLPHLRDPNFDFTRLTLDNEEHKLRHFYFNFQAFENFDSAVLAALKALYSVDNTLILHALLNYFGFNKARISALEAALNIYAQKSINEESRREQSMRMNCNDREEVRELSRFQAKILTRLHKQDERDDSSVPRTKRFSSQGFREFGIMFAKFSQGNARIPNEVKSSFKALGFVPAKEEVPSLEGIAASQHASPFFVPFPDDFESFSKNIDDSDKSNDYKK